MVFSRNGNGRGELARTLPSAGVANPRPPFYNPRPHRRCLLEMWTLRFRHAALERDFPDALKSTVCLASRAPEIIGSGGGETQGTQRMKHAFYDVGWKKFTFEVQEDHQRSGARGNLT